MRQLVILLVGIVIGAASTLAGIVGFGFSALRGQYIQQEPHRLPAGTVITQSRDGEYMSSTVGLWIVHDDGGLQFCWGRPDAARAPDCGPKGNSP
jgi:hypothetical protein